MAVSCSYYELSEWCFLVLLRIDIRFPLSPVRHGSILAEGGSTPLLDFVVMATIDYDLLSFSTLDCEALHGVCRRSLSRDYDLPYIK